MGSTKETDSFFNNVAFVPPDAIFELTKLYNADNFPEKVNLGQGTYKDEGGNPWILPAVRIAREKAREANHEYLPILGLPEFRECAARLVYGGDAAALAENRVRGSKPTCTTPQMLILGSCS